MAQQNLGAGSYGVVVSPALQNNVAGVATNFPDNVTKVFFQKNAYDKAVAKIPTIPTALGVNAGHRMNRYTRSYTGKSLKPAVRVKYGIKRADPIYILRMPNLGKNFGDISSYVDSVRSTPFNTILEQIVKLITQTNTLKTSGHIHGDIRQTNIMFNPTDGTMTIIDFDWLLPKDTFNAEYGKYYGFYSNPPESIVIRNMLAAGSTTVTPIRTADWANTHFRDFQHYYKAIGIKTEDEFVDTVRTANTDNALLIDEKAFRDAEGAAKLVMLPTFDSFGLAITLLEFLTIAYTHFIVANELTSRTIGQLRSALTSVGVSKSGVAYTSQEMNAYSKALLSVANAVLRPMARGRARTRIDAAEALRRAQGIMAELQRDLAPPAPAAAAAAAASARRTRRSRRYRNKSRRAARR